MTRTRERIGLAEVPAAPLVAATLSCGGRLAIMANAPEMQMQGTSSVMITAAQCRSARTLLGWSVNKLANAASVSDRVIDDFELERRQPEATTLDALRRAFEKVGVVFLPDDDVHLRAATPTAR
jgi:hypothetical protein